MLVKLVADFTPEQAARQPTATDNHLLWQLGHLALDYRWFASALDGLADGITARQQELFGMGSRPREDAGEYPALDELRRDLEAAWERLLVAARGLRDEDAGKAPANGTKELRDRLDAVTKCAWHNGWHSGQISGLRKAMGLRGIW
ncbi:MAG: DinB family protein [Deltaproteobacteria bacterium]|nr:DinB family protein [Deltaproteobacteria bacterium]